MTPSELTFWISFIFIAYTYVGYPVILFIWARLFPVPINKSYQKDAPNVSVLIAVKNEEKTIGPRIENLLNQNYPKDKLQIIIVSDGSTDQTNPIVRNYSTKHKTDKAPIVLVIPESGSGKSNALNHGIQSATGEFIVFTDARQTFHCDAIAELNANFSDPTVGCVSGELLFMKNSASNIQHEMGLYWKIEKFVRKTESSIGSVAGATGAIYAIRKALYKKLPPETLLDDVLTPMNIAMQGKRTIFESKALAYDTVSQNAQQEWRRKVRTLAGNWQFFNIAPALFSPRYNPIWWRFLSHKFFRLLVPFFLPLVLTGVILSEGTTYQLFTYLQFAFYLMAAIGWVIGKAREFRLINLCYFFMLLNVAALNGFIYWITGNCENAWEPSGNNSD